MQAGLQILATLALIAVLLAGASLLRDADRAIVIVAGAVAISDSTPNAGPLDWLIIGGGGVPADNQVTIEGDVIDAASTLGGAGRALFSGGSDAACVQVLDRGMRADPLMSELGSFFAPRPGRRSSYRVPKIPSAAATLGAVISLLGDELSVKDAGSLLIYAAGHGELGTKAELNYIALWGGTQLRVTDLADMIDRGSAGRTVRVIATTCFSGGFGELVFLGAKERLGRAKTARCGLFAAPWDLESAGCDPDPDRRRHHGYGAYFLPALRHVGRDGHRLAGGAIDFDGDGRVSLLEAHSRVRIASPTADVPTSTSERWLRHAAPLSGPASAVELPEDDAVIAALAKRLAIDDPAAVAKDRFEAAEKAAKAANHVVATERAAEDVAYHALKAAMLSRWPILDDPWHPHFAALVRSQRGEIMAFMKRSGLWRLWKHRVIATDQAAAKRVAVRTRRAVIERLHRAVETRALAGRLTARGGEPWLYWRQLLRCERFVPKLVQAR